MGRDNEPNITTPSDAQVILDAGKQLGKPHAVEGYKPFAVIGGVMVPLERVEPPKQHHVVQQPHFRDVQSFIAYVNRFQTPNTQIFADERCGQIRAAIDYHVPVKDGGAAIPDRCEHRPVLLAETSPEWKEWTQKNGTAMSQEAFAQFIEDQAPFITNPDAATMLEIATSMQASSAYSFSKAVNLDNGQVQLNYVENIDGHAGPKGSLAIPKRFEIQIRPFIGCSPYTIEARFRWRIDSGRLQVWYDLFRADDVKLKAFEAIMGRVKDETQITPYLGQA